MAYAFDLVPLGALSLETAAELHRAAFTALGERSWKRRDLAELLASPGVKGLLLQWEGRDIGFAIWRVVADEAELLTLAVDPGHRRRGAGGALLAAVLGQARSAGGRSIYLEVGTDNPAARSLYDQSGFKAVGKRAAYYQRGAGQLADAIVMRLRLDG